MGIVFIGIKMFNFTERTLFTSYSKTIYTPHFITELEIDAGVWKNKFLGKTNKSASYNLFKL